MITKFTPSASLPNPSYSFCSVNSIGFPQFFFESLGEVFAFFSPLNLMEWGFTHQRNFSPTSISVAISVKDRVVSAQWLPSINIAMGIAVGQVGGVGSGVGSQF
jgi:hypothetical protein